MREKGGSGKVCVTMAGSDGRRCEGGGGEAEAAMEGWWVHWERKGGEDVSTSRQGNEQPKNRGWENNLHYFSRFRFYREHKSLTGSSEQRGEHQWVSGDA